MTRPANRDRRKHITQALKKESWVLLTLVVLVIVLDMMFFTKTVDTNMGQLVWARSFVLGALLSYISHVLFAWFMFRYSGVKASRHIVNQFYLGESIKWLITIVGFSLIFITIRPLNAMALFIGFIVMQISHSLISFSIK